MKTLPLVFLLLALSIGCQSTNNQQKVSTAVKVAAYTGTAMALAEHPEWRKGFEEAHRDLLFVEQTETIDFVTVLAIVNRLPVKELKSDKAVILITGATILLSDFGGSLPLDQLEQLRPVVKAMREGIELGLQISWQNPGSTNALSKAKL